jgi:flagellar basal-body rod protein FlgB
MMHRLLDNTTIPLLGESIHFTEARHNILVGNVANLDTPGYIARDLSVQSFQERLADAIETRRKPPVSLADVMQAASEDPLREVRDATQSILRHDGANVGMEQQVLEISKNQFLHNLAISVMGSQFRLLQAMISEHL